MGLNCLWPSLLGFNMERDSTNCLKGAQERNTKTRTNFVAQIGSHPFILTDASIYAVGGLFLHKMKNWDCFQSLLRHENWRKQKQSIQSQKSSIWQCYMLCLWERGTFPPPRTKIHLCSGHQTLQWLISLQEQQGKLEVQGCDLALQYAPVKLMDQPDLYVKI